MAIYSNRLMISMKNRQQSVETWRGGGRFSLSGPVASKFDAN